MPGKQSYALIARIDVAIAVGAIQAVRVRFATPITVMMVGGHAGEICGSTPSKTD